MLVSTENVERLPAISSAASDGLPVVEPKPFTQKQWRPAHSLPSAYNPRTAYSVGLSPRRTRWYPEPSSVVVSPRDLPEQASSSRQAFTTSGIRPQNHPKTRDLRLGVQQPQSFVSKLEREKTTTNDIRSSCAPTGSESDAQHSMQVQGRKMEKLPSRPGSIYAPPWDFYNSSRGTSVAAPGTSAANTPQSANRDVAYVYLDDTIYDEFDRSNTLPSINVLPMRRRRRGRRVQRESSPGSGTSSRRSSGRRSRQQAYRLGVANALDVFSRFGQPLFVERQISFQLKNTMRRLRRNRDTSPVSSAGQSQPSTERFDNSIVPTVGEAMIRAGWMMNAGRLPRGYNPLDDLDDDGTEQGLPVFGEYTGMEQQITGRVSVQSPRKRITSDRKRNNVADAERKMPNITELDGNKNKASQYSPAESTKKSATGQPDDFEESAPLDPLAAAAEICVGVESTVKTPIQRIEVDVPSESSPVAEQDSDDGETKDDVTGGNDITPPEQERDAEDTGGNDKEEVQPVDPGTIDEDAENTTNVSDS
ncbi:hypothetical protein LSAT2_000198 [Lamellibrachia satsuma]|nr:hypothetical protein LSAT2_000198 [Lamellibrachia satsuma]